MYSYEDRIRAVQLYIKLGKRIKATIRQLGDVAFRSWWPLPLARLASKNERSEPHSLDVTQSLLTRQRGLRRLLRSAEDRTVLSSGLAKHHR